VIKIIDVNSFIGENRLTGPIVSPQIFLTNSFNFHPKGLMSEEIFGMEGTVERTQSMSWIELNCYVIHPLIFQLLSTRIERRIPTIISGEKTFNLDPNTGELKDPPEGEEGKLNGFTSLYENIDKLRFRNTEGERGKFINNLYKYIKANTFFMNKILVISPDYRAVEVIQGTKQKVTEDNLTNLYKRIIELSVQVGSVQGAIYDVLAYQMQLLINSVYDYVRVKISKKEGMIRKLMLGARVDYSASSVIIPNPNLNIGEVGVPFRICTDIFEPFLLYGLVNSKYVNSIPDEFYIEGKKYLGKESYFGNE